MTLAEKILKLRTARNLSQGDLAEALEVSRQSVSKWETGQSVPDLDKIIKLADLFGVSVDELVREEERPEPAKPEPQIIYIEKEKPALRPIQRLGVVVEALGVFLFLFGLLGAPLFSIVGLVFLLLGLPLLLARKHPFLICGWMVAGGFYLVFNRYWTSVSFYYVLDFLRGGELTMQAIISAGRLAGLIFMVAATLLAWKKSSSKKDG